MGLASSIVFEAMLAALFLIPLGLVGLVVLCVLVLAGGVAFAVAGCWALRRAREAVLGPESDL
jgi:hypothetical protein